MPEHIIKTEEFYLSITLNVFESDIKYPSNAVMTVAVTSGGFSAKTDFEIDIKDFAAFASDLQAIYENLDGMATVKEPYGNRQFLLFAADKTGHITVKGFLCDDLKKHEMRFENSFDQTNLKPFASELFAEYSRYMKVKK